MRQNMKGLSHPTTSIVATAAWLVPTLLLATGCTTLGPVTVPVDRFDYNKVLAQSSEQQLVLNLVRLRYGEPVQWVAVSSMISKYTLQAQAGWSQWYNNLSVFENPALRGILGGVDATPNRQNTWNTQAQYNDSPTITYAPVEGEEFAKRVLTPIPLSVVLYLIQAGWPIDQVFDCCVQRLNDLDNGILRGATQPADKNEPGSDFETVVKHMREFQEAGGFNFRLEVDKDTHEVYAVRNMRMAAEARRYDLFERLGLRADAPRIRLSQSPAPGNDTDTLCVQTRSLLGILQALSHGVQAPNAHVAQGRVTRAEDFVYGVRPSPWLTVQSSPVPACDAFVQVNHYGHWFYILHSDIPSKQTLSLLTYLYSLQGTDAGGKAPLITIPAGS